MAVSELSGYPGRQHAQQSRYVTAEFLREAISTIHQNFTQAMPGSGTAYANVCRACMYFLIYFHAVDAVSSSGSLWVHTPALNFRSCNTRKDNVIYVRKFVNFDEYALRFVSQSRFQICLVSNLNSNWHLHEYSNSSEMPRRWLVHH